MKIPRPRLFHALPLLLVACSSPGGGVIPNDATTGDVNFGGDTTGSDTAGGTDTAVQPTLCQGSQDCAAPKPYCSATGLCVECTGDAQCGAGRCANGFCVTATCTPGEAECNASTLLTCNAQGDGWDTLVCDAGCAEGKCSGCDANTRVCNGNIVLQCRADGSGYDPNQICQADQQCVNGYCLSCPPNARRCNASGQSEVCSATGVWGLGDDCASQGLACLQGTCVSPCVTDIKSKSNSGCDYWAVDLDNHYAAQNGPYAVIVSNLSARVATITVTSKDSASAATVEVLKRDVQPGGLEILTLPNRNMAAAGVFWKAYRVQSTAPIIAYQFNPLDNVDVFSNDASLLMPVNTFGREFIGLSRFELLGGGDNGTTLPYRGTLSVVAANADTEVQITPTTRTLAGTSMQTMLAGQTYTYTLQPFQVLNIKSDQNEGDLTGTLIVSNKDIAVFGGHEAAVSSDVCCADHLEQQLFPVKTWGKTYVATKSFARNQESDYWRVVASEDGTQVTFNPAVAPPRTLNKGAFFEVKTTSDFVVTADKPVMVSQLLASSSEIVTPPAYSDCYSAAQCAPGYTCEYVGQPQFVCLPPICSPGANTCPSGHRCVAITDPYSGQTVGYGCSPTGDPTLILTPPVDQFRDEYVFLTPNKYLDDYINIIAPADASIVLDNVTLPAANFVAIAGSTWRVARLKVTDGVHSLTATAPVGVTVYGYDDDVSYGYPAGLNLSDLP